MVAMAQKAGIKVILGNIPAQQGVPDPQPQGVQLFNAWLAGTTSRSSTITMLCVNALGRRRRTVLTATLMRSRCRCSLPLTPPTRHPTALDMPSLPRWPR